MFDFKEGKVNFNSVEEVKEFLESTDDLNVLGALCFTSPNGEVEQEVPINTLIEEIGIDSVAELLFNLSSGAELVSFTKDEAIALLKKEENGEDLTEEEMKKLQLIKASSFIDDTPERRRQSLYNGVTMTLNASKNIPLFSTVGGVIALFSTYLECGLVTSNEKLIRVFSNCDTANDVVNLAASKITIEEGISPEMAVLGLLHKLGDMAYQEESIRKMPLNFEEIVNVLDLDEEWIFNPDKKVMKEAAHLEGVIGDIQEKLEGLWNGSNEDESEEVSEQNENGSNTEKIVDIRERLKRK